MHRRTMPLRVVLTLALALGIVLAACRGADTVVGPEPSLQAAPEAPAAQPTVVTDSEGDT